MLRLLTSLFNSLAKTGLASFHQTSINAILLQLTSSLQRAITRIVDSENDSTARVFRSRLSSSRWRMVCRILPKLRIIKRMTGSTFMLGGIKRYVGIFHHLGS